MLRAAAWLTLVLLSMLCLGPAARAAEALATLTIIDGEVSLLRDGGKFAAAEGVRLAAADILETSERTQLARIEFADGVIADLGPGTRALLAPRLAGGAKRKPTRLYVLQGWLKLTSAAKAVPGAAPGAPVVLTPAAELADTSGRLVLAALPDRLMAFSEAGSTQWLDRAAKAATAVGLKSGEFLSQAGTDKPVLAPRPTPAFIQMVPRPFLDPLPSRAAQFKAREVAPKRLGDMAYADAAAWLGAEPLLRSFFVSQWRALARRADFRAGLAENMRAHPEWNRIVFPEKYLPKSPAPGAS